VWRNIRRFEVLGRSIMPVAMGLALASCLSVAGISQATQSRSSSDAAMRQHYDAAYRYQATGDTSSADREHKLFLSQALHHVANARANIGEYYRAAPLYDEALRLAPDNIDLQIDYTKAAMDAEDPEKAERLAESTLSDHPEVDKSRKTRLMRIRGEALRNLGQQEKALEQFKAAAAMEPTFDNIYALGNAYLWVGDKADGAKIFAGMLSTFGDTAVMHMSLGRGYAEANFFPEAIAEFRRAIEKNSQMRGLHYSLGASYVSMPGDAVYPQAESEFRKELAIQPNDPFSYPQLGKIALARHDYQEAGADLRRAVTLNPHNADNYLLLAQMYGEMDRVPDAVAALREAIAETPDPSWNHYAIHAAHYQLGRLLLASGNRAGGIKEMQIAEDLLSQSKRQAENTLNGKAQVQLPLEITRVISTADRAEERTWENGIAPLVAASYNNLGVHAAIGGDYGGAATWFERAAEWNPRLKGLDSNWGRAAFAAQEYAQAAAPLQRVLQASPGDREAWLELVVSFYQTGNYKGVLQALQPMAPTLGAPPSMALMYADSLVKTGDFDGGMDRLAELEQANPQDATVHRALGEGYAGVGHYEQAIDELRTAVRLNSSDAAAQYSLAANLIMLGETEEAETLLMLLANAGSRNPEVYYQLGQLMMERGDAGSAISELETAAKISPDNGAVHFALAEAYHRNTRLSDARRESLVCQKLLAFRPGE
jgi:tetratricopeptide (TPR) repeat protein